MRSMLTAMLITPLVLGVAAPAHAAETAKKVSEDEDAFVELSLTTDKPGGGTGWANQVITRRGGAVVSNRTSGWMTFYGLPAKSRVTLQLAKGKCGNGAAAMTTADPVRTDRLGGWHGKVVFSLGASKTWVVRGGYHINLVSNDRIRACGMLKDDPDIGN